MCDSQASITRLENRDTCKVGINSRITMGINTVNKRRHLSCRSTNYSRGALSHSRFLKSPRFQRESEDRNHREQGRSGRGRRDGPGAGQFLANRRVVTGHYAEGQAVIARGPWKLAFDIGDEVRRKRRLGKQGHSPKRRADRERQKTVNLGSGLAAGYRSTRN